MSDTIAGCIKCDLHERIRARRCTSKDLTLAADSASDDRP